MQRAAGRLLAVSGGLIAVPLGFSSCSWCRTPGWGAAMPCAIWNPASCSGRSRCSVSSEGAEGSAAEPPTARRTRHSLQDTLASDGLRGGDGRYSELRASSRPTLPRPACKVGCSARCARPWHRKSSLPAPPIEPPSPIEPTAGQTQTLVSVHVLQYPPSSLDLHRPAISRRFCLSENSGASVEILKGVESRVD